MSIATRFLILVLCIALPYGYATLMNQELTPEYYLGGSAAMLLFTLTTSRLAASGRIRSAGLIKLMNILFVLAILFLAFLNYMTAVMTAEANTLRGLIVFAMIVFAALFSLLVSLASPRRSRNS